MTLGEILGEIDERYPNALSNDSKVRKINKLQKQLFRTVVKNTVGTMYDLIADQAQYPISIHPSKIRELLVNDVSYPYKQLESEATSRFFYILKGDVGYYVGLYPTPTEDVTDGLLIYHYDTPADLSPNDLNSAPQLDEDFHDLLIYGVCKELAEINKEFDVANGFIQQYQGLLDKFLEANQDTEATEIQMDWR